MVDYNKINVNDILPQKDTAVYVDQIIFFNEQEKTLEASKFIKEDEYLLHGHFNNNPIVPGILIIESLAQACILCQYGLKTNFSIFNDESSEHLLYKVNIKFRNKVTIGDDLLLQVKLVENILEINCFKTKAINRATKVIIAQGELFVVNRNKKGDTENLSE
jgi:3-hydroxyacyl-[acyl-carrier-protein] dehydratase